MKNNNDTQSIFQKNIQRGLEAKIISFNKDKSKITYHCSRDYTTSFKNSEETIRASYFSELVIDYNYPKKKIDIEVIVPRRTPEDRADIVIYEDDDLKKPYLVVECKKDGITDAEFKQAIEQAFGNANSLRAKFASVVAGTTKTAFDIAGFKPSEREKNVISDIPERYGKTPKYRFIKGEADKELETVSREELIKALEKAHDTVWQGGKLAPTTAFDEVSKLLFCKLKDEKDTPRQKPYQFQIGTHESPDEVYKRIDNIYQKAKQEDSEVFKEDIKLEPKIVYNVVEHLQVLAINKIDLDTKGIAFERFMQDFFKGKMGQFFTPRLIVQFCIQMMNVQKDNLILDPACGSGGFLLNAMDKVRKSAEENYDKQEAKDHWHRFAQNNLYGIEINDQIARVCKMNMIIHDDGHTNIISADSLDDFENINKINKGFQKDSFDFVLTNPPFGAVIKRSEKDYLDKYVLGKGKNNQKSEILFIERCIDFVKPKTGEIAIVLPDSIAINSSLQDVRDFILEKTQVLSIVSLPDCAFAHYGANVKSSLFFLKKKEKSEKTKYPILMAKAERIGYKATGKIDEVNDFEKILDYFQKFIKDKEKLQINKKDKNNIYLISSEELENKRIDVKGYAPYFKKIKLTINNHKNPKTVLKDCIEKTEAGDWGIDPKKIKDKSNYELCYVLRSTNFDNNFNLDFSKVATRLIKKETAKKLQLKTNDILIEKSGGSPYQPVGRVVLIKKLPFDKPTIFSNFLQKITVNKSIIEPTYVYAYLQTLYQMGYMEYIQNQTTGIKNLLMEEFYNISIIKPKRETQKQIANKLINSIETAKTKIENAYKNLNSSKEEVKDKIFT